MAEIRVPTLGESVTEATIGKWFKKAGEAVAVDEPLVELETDKVTIEVPAPAAGVLSDIAAKDGETVAVGALLGQIKEGAGAPAAMPLPPAAKPRTRRSPPPKPPKLRSPRPPPPSADTPLAPSVRKWRPRPASTRQGRRLRQGWPRHQGRHAGGDRARRRLAHAGAADRRRGGPRAVAGRRCGARGAREDDAGCARPSRGG